MTKLNQIIAIEKDVRSRATKAREAAAADLAKGGPLTGISRIYKPRTEDGDQLPPEATRVQYTVDHVTENMTRHLGRLWNVTATKDWANAEATADVVVDGETLLVQAPASFLVWFEKQVVDLLVYVSKIPILDPAEVWTYDETSMVYRSEPAETVRTRKVPKVLVKYEATSDHPAQVETYMVDEPEGTWETTKFSGAIPAARKADMLMRLSRLVEAVKFAREEANQHTVIDRDVSAPVLAYLFD